MARIETVIAVMAMCLFPAAHSVAADSKLPAAQPLVDSPLNLLERLPVARIGVDDASLESLPIDSADYFAGGWYQPAEAGDGQQYRWLGPGAGVIDIALVQAEELMVSFGVTAPRDDRVPPIHARFLWNGAYAGGIELGGAPQTVKMKVPAELTRPGMNRLEVLPSFWVNASRLAGGSSSTNVSINVFRVTIAPTADASNRVRGLRPVVRAGVGVEQFANSTVSYYTRIEKGSRLTAAGRWLDDSHGVERSEALVLVRDGRGNTKTILHADSGAYVDPVASVADLSEFAGEFVEITTIVRQASESGSRPRPMLWTELSVTEESLPSVATTRVLDERPNIVLLMFDTLRADFTEPYGATDVSTPNFRALAEESATFLNAFAPTSWTRSSVATMMSSLHETRHGTVTIADKLAEEVPYLPERLRDNGYRTIGISMNGHITRQWGFDRGFDAFHELGRQREQIVNEDPTPDGYMNGLWDRYVAPERENAAGPFFLYFHEIDPHGPYTPRAPFDAMYPSPYSGHPELEADNINLVRQGLTELRPQDIAHLRTRYRGEVSFIDAVLGALMNRLRAEGLADNTILIVTSDHGEEFGEHGGIGHMVTLYDEVLRVPLIWSWPERIRPTREPATAGLIDVAPTLLETLGLPIPPEMEGRDLSPVMRGASPMREYPVLGQLGGNRDRARRSVAWAGWKLCERRFGAESEYELFNTLQDPGEVTNQWTSQREAGGALRQLLEWYAYQSSGVGTAKAERIPMESLDPELVEELRNLGYVE